MRGKWILSKPSSHPGSAVSADSENTLAVLDDYEEGPDPEALPIG